MSIKNVTVELTTAAAAAAAVQRGVLISFPTLYYYGLQYERCTAYYEVYLYVYIYIYNIGS